MRQSLQLPVVQAVVRGIRSYNAGSHATRLSIAMNGFARGELSPHVALLAISHNMIGGDSLLIMLKNQPSRVYLAWVYRLESGRRVLRQILTTKCSAAQVHWLHSSYDPLIYS